MQVCTIVLSMLCLDVYECIARLSSPMYLLLKVQPGFTAIVNLLYTSVITRTFSIPLLAGSSTVKSMAITSKCSLATMLCMGVRTLSLATAGGSFRFSLRAGSCPLSI